MIETLIFSVLGSFIYDNAEFFKTANEQYNQPIIGNGITKKEM